MSLSKGSKIGISLLIVVALGSIIGYKMVYKPHPKTMDQKAVFVGTALDFQQQVVHRSQKWQNAIVSLKGKVTNLDKHGITLNQTIYCQLEDSLQVARVKTNALLAIKGRFIGYDDLLEEIKLDQCIITRLKDEKN
ncbi:MAG TPA: hypothetical protein DCS93_39345 [Microscillaceae bacterium]|nr:hypothetical protein [Microscillaceae bacterium]